MVRRWMTTYMLLGSSLQRGQACSHDFVDEKKVASDDGARMNHLPLDVVVVVDAQVCRVDDFSTGTVHSNWAVGVAGFTQKFDQNLLRIKTWKKID